MLTAQANGRRSNDMRLTYDEIDKLVRYEPETGKLFWKKARRGAKGRKEAGCFHKKLGYVVVGVARQRYYAHRVAWLLMTREWPAHEIDHMNGIGSDNRWCNLRHATSSQNKMNKSIRSDNKVGLKGVWLHSPGKWRSKARVNGVSYDLGLFNDPFKARAAYLDKIKELHGEFAYSGEKRC